MEEQAVAGRACLGLASAFASMITASGLGLGLGLQVVVAFLRVFLSLLILVLFWGLLIDTAVEGGGRGLKSVVPQWNIVFVFSASFLVPFSR